MSAGNKKFIQNVKSLNFFMNNQNHAEIINQLKSGKGLRNPVIVNVDLSGADLQNVKLRGITFQQVNLSGANFSGVRLTGCTWINSNLDRADFSETTFLVATFKADYVPQPDPSKVEFSWEDAELPSKLVNLCV